MRATRDERRLSLRDKRLTAAAIGLFVIAVAITVALPAGAGSNRRALRDVHGTKAFWQQTTLKRAIAASPGTPTLKFRAKAIVQPYRLNVRALHKALANTPWEHTPERAAAPRGRRRPRRRTGVSSVSPSPALRRSWRRGSSGSIPRSRPTAASASTIPARPSTPT